MLYDGWNMNPDEGQEEFEEVSAELKRKDEAVRREGERRGGTGRDREEGRGSGRGKERRVKEETK